ncbi:MAG: PAS domain S-box protein [Acidobacteria bacterium]|nr:PAS domain S-box protein [Acidobacteriota bacterium]
MIIGRFGGISQHILTSPLPVNIARVLAILIVFSFAFESSIAETSTQLTRPPEKQVNSQGMADGAKGEPGFNAQPQSRSDSRVVRVGLYENKPKIFSNEKGAASGIFAVILDEIARREGWQLTYVPCDWAACLEALDKGAIHLMPDVAYSEERDAQFDFHKEMVINSWSAAYAKSKYGIGTLSDLNGRRVAVLKDSIQKSILENMAKGFGLDIAFIEAETLDDVFSAAGRDQAEAAISNYLFGDYFYSDYGLEKTHIVFNPVSLFFATTSGANSDLLEAIDTELCALKSEPGSAYYRALGRWMQKPSKAIIPRYAIWIIAGTSGLLLLSFAFILLLRRQVALRTRDLDHSNQLLRESEEKFRNLFYKHAAVKLLINPDNGRIVEANEAAEKFYGWSGEQLHQMQIQDINMLPPEQVDMEMKKARNLERTHFIFRHRLADGSIRDVAVFSSRINAKNEILLHSIIHDITEQKQAENAQQISEQALRDSELKYRMLFETAGDAIMLMRDDQFIDCNAVTLATFECARDQFIGAAPYEFSPPTQPDGKPSKEKAIAMINLALSTGPQRFEWTHCRRDGTPFPAEVSLNRLELNGETILQAIVRDITERKRAEAEQAKLQAQFIQAQKMESLGRLAGGVAHDYNNILSIILGYSELALEKTAPQDPLYNNLKEIQSAAERSIGITKQLLAYARKETIAPELIDLNASIESMLNMLRRLIGEDIDLEWIPGKDMMPVLMDPAQLDQILANLCVNARDAISNVGRIAIVTGNATFDEAYCSGHEGFMPGDFAMISVSDDGCGMDRETLDVIFEPFFTTKSVGCGTGLGLATVYGIVKQNNGFINVYSEPEEGTTFRIYLPAREGKVKEAVQKDIAETPQGNGETILVVEDEASILELIEKIITRLNYIVIKAHSPSEALQAAKAFSGKIDLLITDVILPEMNGRQFAEQMKAFLPEIKCLFISGYTADVIVHRGILDSGLNFIQKPFSNRDLAIKIREALERS